MADRQEIVDRFYFANGPCCAGCDWWRSISVQVGECTRSAPVPADQRLAMVGVEWSSLRLSAGHVLTPVSHTCGEFKDEFDWSTLPPNYRRAVGDPNAPKRK